MNNNRQSAARVPPQLRDGAGPSRSPLAHELGPQVAFRGAGDCAPSTWRACREAVNLVVIRALCTPLVDHGFLRGSVTLLANSYDTELLEVQLQCAGLWGCLELEARVLRLRGAENSSSMW